MGPKLSSKKKQPSRDHPLFWVLKRLASDLHALFELASKDEEKSWHDYLMLAKKEVEGLQFHPGWKRDELLLYKSLVPEVYDHLNLLINSLQSSQERYKRMATRDLLTGVYNRNYFNETIVRDIERAKRRNERLSIIMIDVNGFKKINDTYGHLHGDGVLRACADILTMSVRKADFLCRFGGDEFIIVTPHTGCDGNQPLFDRIHKNTDQWNVTHGTLDYQLSFSMGCAVWEQGEDVLQVIQQADQEMYRNKKEKILG